MQQLKPVTLKLSVYKVYKVASLIERITDTDTPFVNVRKTNEMFKQMSKDIYHPFFKFLELHKLEVNIVITGEFLDKLKKYAPRSLTVLRRLVKGGYVTLVLDAYYGNSLSSLYNMSWWARSIEKTRDRCEEILHKDADFVFLPQLYRTLELERVVHKLGKKKFLLRNKGKKIAYYKTKLSSLRRFDGHPVSWVKDEKDEELEFHYIPNNYFMMPNELMFEKDLETSVRAFSMKVGWQYNKFFLNPRLTKNEKTVVPRLNEKSSLGYYSHLQKSIIRLWDYASFIIASEEHIEDQEYTRIKTISRNFAALQDPFFLLYLLPKFYNTPHQEVKTFSSPYEAYVSMQACVKHLEILLKNKI